MSLPSTQSRFLRLASFVFTSVAWCLLMASSRADWVQVFTDDFTRPDSRTLGNGWRAPAQVARIVDEKLVLTVPTGGTGTDLRLSRPIDEESLDQRIEATFVMPPSDAMAHSVFVRGKSLTVAGQELHPVAMASVRHSGVVVFMLGYRGGASVYPQPQGSPNFIPVPGNTYRVSFEIRNRFASSLFATLYDETNGVQVAATWCADAGQYSSPKSQVAPDFVTPGVMGLAMEGPSGGTTTFRKVTTYRRVETGALTAAFSPLYDQHSGRTYLASPFPSGGIGPYRIRWYRGGVNFTPPVNADGTGPGSGTYLGDTWELVDLNPPRNLTTYSISYRAVYFDAGANTATGVLGRAATTRSPTLLRPVMPYWIGDSITGGYGTSGTNGSKSVAAYAQYVVATDEDFPKSYFIPPGVLPNFFGVNGRTSAEAAADLPRLLGRARFSGATIASIMLGTNDSKNSVATSPADYKRNIATVMNALREQRPDMKFVLNKPPWFLPDVGFLTDFSTASLGRLATYHSMLDQLADGSSVVVGTLTPYLEFQQYGWTGTPGRAMPANATTAYPPAPAEGQSYLVDGLHPYDGGAEMMARLEWGPNIKNVLKGDFTIVPAVDAGPNITLISPQTEALLSGRAMLSGGTIASYAWSQVSGAPATIQTPNAAATAVSGLTVGSYVFRLTALGSSGTISSDEVVVSVDEETAYEQWIARHGIVGDAALPDADLDGNGLSNLKEYAFGIPHGDGGVSSLPTASVSDGLVHLDFQKVRPDITYQVEWSDDLITWSTAGITLSTTGQITTAAVAQGPDGRRAMRVRVYQP